MDAKSFVEGLAMNMRDGTVRTTKSWLQEPLKQPDKKQLQAIEFYSTLSPDQKTQVDQIISYTSNMSYYLLLCILDHKSTVENSTNKGKLELYYEKNGQRTLLNDLKKVELTIEAMHVLYDNKP